MLCSVHGTSEHLRAVLCIITKSVTYQSVFMLKRPAAAVILQ